MFKQYNFNKKLCDSKQSAHSRKMTKSKIIFLCMAMLLCVVNSLAQECDYSGTIGPLNWCLRDGTLTISGEGEMSDYAWNGAPWYPYRELITNIVIENGVTTIGDNAFMNCGSFAFVTMPSVTSIGSNAFMNCTSLASVDMPNVTTIGIEAFRACRSLASVDMPNATTIGNYAFGDCTSLASVSIPSSLTSIGRGPFSNCTSLTSINVDSNNANFASENGILFNKNKTSLIQYPAGKHETNYTVPNSVTTVGQSAFSGCSSLVSVVIPNVTTIENFTFFECGALASVEMPNVTTIRENAFNGCTDLVYVEMPHVTTIDANAFRGCTSLVSITFPASLTMIRAQAFANCTSLEHIYCFSSTPPSAYNNSTFASVPVTTCILHVPVGTVDVYMGANGWQEFTNVVGETMYFANGVVTIDEEPLPGVNISYEGGLATTNSAGNYTITVSLGTTVTITPHLSGYEFTPASITHTVTDDVAGLNFIATKVVNIFNLLTSGNKPVIIYPNPANDILFIECEYNSTIKIHDILGKEVLSQLGNGKTAIDIKLLPKGVYNVSVISNGKVIGNNKVVKQ